MSQKRWGKTCLAELHDVLAHGSVLRNDRTDADTCLRITLRYRVDQYHVLLDAFQVAGRDVGSTRVAELAIDFVREEVEVVLLHDVAQLLHLLHRVEVARRVVGVADQDALGAWGDEFLKLLQRG